MSTPQNTIAIVYDYDQTLSPSYMQDEVVFPAFGINPDSFWRRCAELRESGYDRVTLAEIPSMPEVASGERLMRYYKMLWTELTRP